MSTPVRAAAQEVDRDDPVVVRTPRNPNLFKRVWAAHSVSTFGDQMTLVALPLAAYARTQSAVAVGIAASMEAGTALVFGLMAGAVADRLRHRKVLVATDAARAAVLGAVAMAVIGAHYPIIVLYAAAFALGALRVLHDAAAGAVLPMVVDEGQLLRANGRMQASESGATTVGPAIAGLLISVGGPALALAADAATFAVSGATVRQVRELDVHRPTALGWQGFGALWVDIREGMSAVWRDSMMMRAVAVVAGMNLVAIAVEAQFIPYAREVLHIGGAGIGVFFAIGGAAATLTALLVGRSSRTRGDAMVVGTAIFATGVLVAGLHPSLVTAGLAYVGAGVGSGLVVTHFYALRQRRFPVALQGRVTMATRVIVLGALPVAFIAGGLLSRSAGPEAFFVVAGAVGLAVSGWGLASGLARLRLD